MAGRKPTCKRELGNGKKCNKPADHTQSKVAGEKQHGYTPPKPRPELDFASIQVTKVTDRDTMQRFRRTRGERGKDQKLTDQLVKAAHAAWIEAGKPDDWGDNYGMHVRLPAAQLETFRSKVTNAGTFLGVKARVGSVLDGPKGTVELVVTAVDRPSNDDEENSE